MSSKIWIHKNALFIGIFLLTLFFVVAGGLYSNARWVEYKEKAETHALLHGASIAAALNGEQLAAFFNEEQIPSNADLNKFNTRMSEVINANSMLHYIGLYTIHDDDIYLLVDTFQSLKASDIPQQLLQDEADRVFALQRALLSPVFPTGQRTYTLVLAPMHDLQTHAIYGVLVIALDAKELYDSPFVNTLRQVLIIFISWLCLLISVLMYRLYKKSQSMRKDLEVNNQQLLQTDAEMQLLVDQMPQALAVHELICDELGRGIDYRFLKVNPMFTQFTGLSQEQLIGQRVLEVLPKTESYWIEAYSQVALTGLPKELEHYSIQFNRWFLVHAYSPKIGQFITIFEDVTEQRARQKELEFLNFHDSYTRMYNRNAFLFHFSEYDKRKMHPLAIVLFDINGLKDINDTYGFDVGDQMIQQLGTCIQKHCVSDTWIAARIDGDMFGLLIPYAKEDEIDRMVTSIQNNCKQSDEKEIPISVSYGCAIKNDEGLGFEAVLRKAEDDLFEHKIAEHASSRQQTIEILLQSLFSKCPRERAHSNRVSIICSYIARE
ncbi:MAG: GGDEF domain-containing protein, partial [Spirochaetia bacterium]|nr:GGDEF domain-containing protein [Spirochaetia bacterium]